MTAGSGVDFELASFFLFWFTPQSRGQSLGQFVLQSGDIAKCAGIRLRWRFFGHVGSGHNVNLVTQVIEGQQAVEKHQFRVGE